MKRTWGRKRKWAAQDWLNLLTQISRELTSGLDLAGVARRALALSVQTVGASLGSLLLLDEEERPVMVVLLDEGRFRRGELDLARKALQEGLAGWALQKRQAILVDDLSSDPRRVAGSDGDPSSRAGAVICVPLILPRRAVGVLTCADPRVGYFDQDDLQMLQLIGDQAAVALENAWLFAAEEQRRGLADTLSEIARTLAATLDLDEVLLLILEHLSRVVHYDSAAIFLLQDNRLTIRAWRGFENEKAIRSLSFGLGSGHIMARLVASRTPLVCADVQQEQGWENIRGVPPVRAWIGAPLLARGEVVGALTVDSLKPGTYSEADARLVAAFADHAAVAAANARLWQQIQRRLEEVAFLHQTGQALTESLELEDVLRSLMDSVRGHFRVEAASVALVEEETGDLVFRVAAGAAADQVIGVRLKPGQGIAGWVASSGQPALIPATQRDERWYRGVDATTGFRTQAMMAVPIRLGQQTIGVIEAINPQDGRLEEGDLKLLMNVAALAASAIQNARHFTRARDAEQRYSSLFENSADPIVITDTSGKITDVNRRFCEMLGYQREELVGRQITSLHRDPQATKDRLAQAVGGEDILYNVEAIAYDGRSVPFEVRATRVVHGHHPYVQWVCHDLTERLRLEQARRDLTHMIIHDLRNPVSSIMNSLELIRTAMADRTISIPIDQLFGIAQRSGERLYLLIDSILDLAQLEEGATRLAHKAVDVVSIVNEVVEQVRPTAAAHDLSLECRVASSLPTIWGDRNLLQRVLLNLLDNALKFTPPGGKIGVEVNQPDPETVLFVVSDTGPGISSEHHQAIFDRFVRAGQTEVRGTGLGLAFCRLAVEAHGGRIWVESAPGQGANFKFTLPVGEQA